MSRPRPVRVGLLAGLCAAGLLGGAAPVAAQNPPLKVTATGTELFSDSLATNFRLKPLHRVKDLADFNPADTLVIVFGDLGVLDDIQQTPWHKRQLPWAGWRQFLDNGGAVLIASDRHDIRLTQYFDVETFNLQVRAPLLEGLMYRDNPLLPLVKTPQDHIIFKGLNKGLATNKPSCLRARQGSGLQVLCRFDEQILSDRPDLSEMVDGRRVLPPLMVGSGADAPARGRVLIIAGHGMFINGMMFPTDNDNLTFANNCIRWLTDDGKRKRTHVLFVVDNKAVTELALPRPRPPLPPFPPVPLLNQILRIVEEQNLFNEALLLFVPKEAVVRWVLLGGAALLLVLALVRLAGRRLPLALGPLPRLSLTALLGLPPLATLRRGVVLRDGNLWEAARVLARQCFEGKALRRPDIPPRAATGPPDQRLRLEALVRHLWHLAYGEEARPVLLPEFARLLEALAEVQAALAGGALAYPIA
jgi:hypothetical protein